MGHLARGLRSIGDNLCCYGKTESPRISGHCLRRHACCSLPHASQVARRRNGSSSVRELRMESWPMIGNLLTAELTPAGVAARIANVDWLTFSPDREFLFVASEVDSFNGKPTGEVASFSVIRGELHLAFGAQNSAGQRAPAMWRWTTPGACCWQPITVAARRPASGWSDGQAWPPGVAGTYTRQRAQQGSAGKRARALRFVLAR
jgi:hypothetical protein